MLSPTKSFLSLVIFISLSSFSVPLGSLASAEFCSLPFEIMSCWNRPRAGRQQRHLGRIPEFLNYNLHLHFKTQNHSLFLNLSEFTWHASGTITLRATVPWWGVHTPAQDDKTSRATWIAHCARRTTNCASHLCQIFVLALSKLEMQLAEYLPPVPSLR